MSQTAARAPAADLENASRLIAAERMMAVLVRTEVRRQEAELSLLPGVQRLEQPAYRGSAAEIFLPALKIAHEDPDATAVILPPDPIVDHDARFMHYVALATRAVEVRQDIPVVIGGHPRAPDPRHAWIEPGAPVEGLEAFSIRAVRRFVSRPSAAEAASLFEGHALLSTLVIITKVRTLLELGRAHVPEVLETLEPVEAAFGRAEEPLLTAAVYECMPEFSLASEVLEGGDRLAGLAIPDLTWSAHAGPVLALAC